MNNKEYQRIWEELAGTLLRRLPPVERWAYGLTLLLMAALAWTFAQLSWRLLPVIPQNPVAMRFSSTARAGNPVVQGFAQLSNNHLFGQPMVESGPINAPETTLNLTLRGIFALDNGQALAIIASGNLEELPYQVGDSLPGGASLHEIDVDRVILERNGRFETLTLPKDSLASSDNAEAVPGSTPSTGPNGNLPAQLGEIRQRLKANPAELMGMNALRPVMENGQLKGYQITDNPYMPIMRKAGLQPGDVVTSVNGIPVTDPSQASAILNQLSNANHVQLEVQRGGVPTSMSIDLGN